MPTAGVHYPATLAQMRAWFPSDEKCLDYLDWLRWTDGFTCPHCGDVCAWEMRGRVLRCGGCRRRVSRTVGTIFQDTRIPLTAWFEAAWWMTVDKQGISASALQRMLDLGSYQTAWTMLHRYRVAMGTTGTAQLTGTVEVDESFLGGHREGPRGRGALGKVMVGIAVELLDPKGFGRARIKVLPNAKAPALERFLLDCVEPDSLIVTDGLSSYPRATGELYRHKGFPVSGSGFHAHELLPAVHRVASLLKRWLLGTHQGSITPGHVQAYLDEFVFRFNRRHAAERGLLFYQLLQASVGAPPTTYRSLVVDSKPKKVSPTGRTGPKTLPGTLTRPPEDRPWRDAEASEAL